MPRSSLSRLVCALLVMVLSALPLAAAEPAAPRAAGFSAGLSSLWSWLEELWGDNGCFIDPSGGGCSSKGTPSVPAENENGCFIDPNGGCHG
jgi:hypothetical protein